MSISRVVVPSTSSFSKVCTVPTSGKGVVYKFAGEFVSGIYTISCVSSTVAYASFYSGQTLVASTQTLSGVVSVTLVSDASVVRLRTSTGTNVLVSIEKTGEAVPSGALGVVDTISTTSTYNCPSASLAVACAIGGGGGGGRPQVWPNPAGGGGGGSGFADIGVITPGQSYSVVIGAGGSGGSTPTNGGSTTISGLTGLGGNKGGNGAQFSGGGGGAGGSNGSNGTTSATPAAGGVDGTPGSGVSIGDFATSTQGTSASAAGGLYGGGVGGRSQNAAGGNATLYGGGGGGGGSSGSAFYGGDGASGVVYVLRWS